jgi:hypothetical protein
MRTMSAIAVLTPAIVGASACTSSSVSSTGAHEDYNNLTGNLTSVLEAPLDKAHAATEAAFKELEFTVDPADDRKDALQAVVKARMADKNTVTVTLVKKSDNVTEATVGVGTLGKDSTAKVVMDKIRAHLK